MDYRATALTALWLRVKRRERIDNHIIVISTVLIVVLVITAVARLSGWPGLSLP